MNTPLLRVAIVVAGGAWGCAQPSSSQAPLPTPPPRSIPLSKTFTTTRAGVVAYAERSNPDAAVFDFSTVRVTGAWQSACLVHRSCEEPTKKIAPCTPEVVGRSWHETLPYAKQLEGRSVTILGSLRLSPPGCTLAFCRDNYCCNDCAAPLIVADGVEQPLPLNSWCTGDDSQLCCPYEARGQDVAVTGTLVVQHAAWPHGYGLEVTSVCELRPSPG